MAARTTRKPFTRGPVSATPPLDDDEEEDEKDEEDEEDEKDWAIEPEVAKPTASAKATVDPRPTTFTGDPCWR